MGLLSVHNIYINIPNNYRFIWLQDPEGEREQLKKLGFDLPREAFPEPPTPADSDDEDLEDDDGSKGEDDDQMLEVIKKIAARAKEEEEKRKKDKQAKK
jgi:hypothetical protein